MRRPFGLFVWLAFVAACKGSSDPAPVPAALAAASDLHLVGEVATPLPTLPSVRLTDFGGRPVSNYAVIFSISAGGGTIQGEVQVTNSDGRATLGGLFLPQTAGTATVTATVAGITPVQFSVTASPGPAVSIAFVPLPSGIVEHQIVVGGIVVELKDQYGNRATTSTGEITLSINQGPPGANIGGTTQRVSVEGASIFSDLVFSAAGLPSPAISSVSPSVVSSGALITVRGTQFAAAALQNDVRVAGLPANVISGNATELNVVAPTFPVDCEVTRNATVEVRVPLPTFTIRLRASATGFQNATSDPFIVLKSAAISHPIRTAPQLALAVGQSQVLSTAESARCAELPHTGGRYFISVFTADATLRSVVSYALGGKASTVAGGMLPAAAPLVRRSAQMAAGAPLRAGFGQSTLTTDQTVDQSAHTRQLLENLRILRENPHPRFSGAASAGTRAGGAIPPPAMVPFFSSGVGAVNQFRYSFTSCGEGYTTITGRTAAVGNHVIIVEDLASFGVPALNGTLDAHYDQLAAELDLLMWPMIQQNFGNPLLIDAQMDNHGKVIVLFSPQVLSSGAQAFVFACDFFPRSTFAKSNQAPIVYARVPTIAAPGFGTSTPAGWYRVTRSTLAHELKHLASYAERVSRSALAGFEEPWLEEAGARAAEEIYSRGHNGNAWKDNSSYRPTFFCDLHPTLAQCTDKPMAMAKHFGAPNTPPGLYHFLSAPETSSLLCLDASCPDASFYASAWSMLRWATDHMAEQENAFFSGFTKASTLSGARNLESVTGLTWPVILGEWSLMLATDDIADFTPVNSRLRFPSWNLSETFSELHADFPQDFAEPYPLNPHRLSFSNFLFNVPTLINGGFSMFELSGAQTGSQVIELLSPFGGAPPPTVRMAVVRVQ